MDKNINHSKDKILKTSDVTSIYLFSFYWIEKWRSAIFIKLTYKAIENSCILFHKNKTSIKQYIIKTVTH